ncbi:MAG: type II toxin-antitoxin system VapC family toxin [Candidatus Rokuibacteriota bacterium]
MADVLVDSNVILDVTTEDPRWYGWSARQLEGLAERHTLVINPVIYAEVSVGFERIEDLDAALPVDLFRREALPWEAGFLAGRCFLQYRRKGGARRSPLPDFFIGAHAAVRQMVLVTRDPLRYRSYFPRVQLVTP